MGPLIFVDLFADMVKPSLSTLLGGYESTLGALKEDRLADGIPLIRGYLSYELL